MVRPWKFSITALCLIYFTNASAGGVPAIFSDSTYEIKRTNPYIFSYNSRGKVVFSGHEMKAGDTIVFELKGKAKRIVLGKVYFPVRILFEDKETLTLQFLSDKFGSFDMFVINKKDGRFAMVSAGNYRGMFSFTTFGYLE